MNDSKKIVAIQGSFRKNGKTTQMLKYAVKKAQKSGPTA